MNLHGSRPVELLLKRDGHEEALVLYPNSYKNAIRLAKIVVGRRFDEAGGQLYRPGSRGLLDERVCEGRGALIPQSYFIIAELTRSERPRGGCKAFGLTGCGLLLNIVAHVLYPYGLRCALAVQFEKDMILYEYSAGSG